MSQQIKIARSLEFLGGAKHYQNIKGPMHPEMVHFHDHFTDDTLSSDKWLATVTNHTIAVDHTYPGGWALITTDTTNNESSHLATPLAWQDDMNAICEARFLVTDVSGGCLFFGFSDETEESTPDMPIDYSGGALAAAATNAVGIVSDAGDTVNGVSSIVAVGVNNGTPETAIDSATDWADGKIHVLRVELNPDGDASFYLDGLLFGFMETAIVSGTMLCIIIAVANRDSSIDTIYVDRVDGWQDEYTV